MENPIKLIHKFNKDAGLLDNGYDDFLESSMLVEEALEGLVNNHKHTTIELHDQCTPKDLSRHIVSICIDQNTLGDISDVDRLDKACDTVIIAVGSMAKLGLNPQQITKALNTVMRYNNAKLGMPKDLYGKLTKPDSFIPPQEELQKLLNERT